MTVRLAAVIPLKAVARSKTRMAAALTASDRALLLQRTFQRVGEALVGAVSVDRVIAVVGDQIGADWAADLGFEVLHEPPKPGGLNAAIGMADAHLGRSPSIVVPADLPLVGPSDVDGLAALLTDLPLVVVAPTSDGGTGALVRTPGAVIRPCFGVRSAAAHQAEADRHEVAFKQVWMPGFALDLDRPGDIELAGGWSAVTGDVGSAPPFTDS